MIKLSQRVQTVLPSATLAMAGKARELKARGVNVISFATGEPDFDTPSFIKEAAKEALDEGLTKYSPTSGIPELKAAIRRKLECDNSLSYSDNEIVVTCGAKLAIYNALQAIIDPGDEVIVLSPYWVSYPDQIRLADGVPVFVRTAGETSFKATPDMISKAITPATRAIILNTPSNPSGSAYTSAELAEMAKVFVEHNVAIISDEIYEKLVYGDFVHTSIVSAYPEARSLTIVINGVSKAYSMTGFRMGYAAGPKNIISKMTALVGQQITGIPVFVQKACVKALSEGQDEVEKMRKAFEKRRDLMLELVHTVPALGCHVPEGAFYLLPNVEAYLGLDFAGRKIEDASALAEYLLDEAHIATVSGDPFGVPGHLRFSYATSEKHIIEGMQRLKDALAKLK